MVYHMLKYQVLARDQQPPSRYLVFHDAWMEDVARAVAELEAAGTVECEDIGRGADHRRDYDQRPVVSTGPEGKLCRKTHGLVTATPSFVERRGR